uniref:Potassium channel tetramerization domain containing 4 n=1 Tax=Eptatretus burgeri TaxID=7764 RepID=A0A8C4N259_EPTBU
MIHCWTMICSRDSDGAMKERGSEGGSVKGSRDAERQKESNGRGEMQRKAGSVKGQERGKDESRTGSERSVVKLCVGGTYYAATWETLAQFPDSVPARLARGEEVPGAGLPDMGDGVMFIEADGMLFRHVLSFLRAATPAAANALVLPEGFHEAEALSRDADQLRLPALRAALIQRFGDSLARPPVSFLELCDRTDSGQGVRVFCTVPRFLDKLKARVVSISKSRLERFPPECILSTSALLFRHVARAESGAKLLLKDDSLFICPLESLKHEFAVLALREGFQLHTALDRTGIPLAQYDALHFFK